MEYAKDAKLNSPMTALASIHAQLVWTELPVSQATVSLDKNMLQELP